MKVKRLFFESVKDGIKSIKSEFGPDAIIIDIKENMDSTRKGYEILIAIDEEAVPQEVHGGEVMKKMEEITHHDQVIERPANLYGNRHP